MMGGNSIKIQKCIRYFKFCRNIHMNVIYYIEDKWILIWLNNRINLSRRMKCLGVTHTVSKWFIILVISSTSVVLYNMQWMLYYFIFMLWMSNMHNIVYRHTRRRQRVFSNPKIVVCVVKSLLFLSSIVRH